MGQDRFDASSVWMSTADVERQINALLSDQSDDSNPCDLITARALCELVKRNERQNRRPISKAACEGIFSWINRVWDLHDRALVSELCQLTVLAPSTKSAAFLLVESSYATGELNRLIRHAADLAGKNYLLHTSDHVLGHELRLRLSLQLQSAPVTQRDVRQGTLWAIILKAAIVFLLVEIAIRFFQGRPSDHVLVVLDAAGDFLVGLVQLAIVYYFVCQKHGQPIVDGFSLRLPTAASMFWGTFLGITWAALMIALALTVMRPAPGADPGMIGRASLVTGLLHVATSLWFALATQVFHQGFMYPAVRSRHGVVVTIILVSFVFAWMTSGGIGRVKPTFLALNFVRGAVSSTQRHLTGSPWPAILTEWSFLLTMFAAFAVATVLGL